MPVSPHPPPSAASDPPPTLSSALVRLGFEPARSHSLDWLLAYPDAAPLLNAIRTSFTPDCVLTPQQVHQLSSNPKCASFLHCPDALAASPALVDHALKYGQLAKQKADELRVKKKQLAVLRAQKEILSQAVRRKEASASASQRVASPGRVGSVDSCREAINRLSDSLQYVSRTGDVPKHVVEYVDREQTCITEAFAHAQHFLEKHFVSSEAKADDSPHLSVEQLVKTYGEIKASMWMHEARLARINATLTALSLKGSTYLEMSSSAMPSVLKELQKRTQVALETNRAQVMDQAVESIQSRLEAISLEQILRQQTVVLDISRACCKHFLEQRLRLLCFNFAASEQERRYSDLMQSLQDLASLSFACPQDIGTASKGQSEQCQTILDEDEHSKWTNSSDSNSDSNGIEPSTNGSADNEASEDRVFNNFTTTITERYRTFLSQIGLEDDSQLSLQYHPQFARRVEQAEAALGQNAKILRKQVARQMTTT